MLGTAPLSASHGTGTWASAVGKGDGTPYARWLKLSMQLDISQVAVEERQYISQQNLTSYTGEDPKY